MKELIEIHLPNTKIIAHRGLSGIAPENTNEAFRKAGEIGSYGIECDIHATKDHEFVVIHDYTLERMTKKKGFVKDLTLNELRQMTIITGNGIKNYQNVLIPTLQEYLDICNEYHCVPIIEIKEVHDFKDLDQLIELLNKNQIKDQAIIISFHLNYLIYIKEKYPNVQIELLVETITNEVIEICKNYHFDVDTNCETLSKEQIDLCHQNQILVNSYTVDDPQLAYQLSEYGIDMITSNRLINK